MRKSGKKPAVRCSKPFFFVFKWQMAAFLNKSKRITHTAFQEHQEPAKYTEIISALTLLILAFIHITINLTLLAIYLKKKS